MSIEAAYNDWAVQYDVNGNKTRDLDRDVTKRQLGNLNFDSVIELGCGTGKNTEFILTKASNIIGIDFSAEMLKIAKAKFETDQVRFQQADLLKDWDISDNFADLVTCNLVLEHVENLDTVFNQTSRKIKPNGIFYISELHPYKQYTGSKARFETTEGIRELTAYVHHISDYLIAAEKNNFRLLKLDEWFDESSPNEIPRLISFIFRLSKK